MLKLQSREPEWLDIMPGVRILFAPIGMKAVRAAREAVREILGQQADDLIGAGDALSRALIARGILGWEGVGDREGNELPVTPEAIELFLDDPTAFEAADDAYVRPWAKRDMEKNASAGSANGTGAAETPAGNIVHSRAKRKPKGAVPSARTAKTSPKPRKAKPSGQS